MKKIILSVIIVSFFVSASAQSSGIQFAEGLSWQQILARAKAENKYIFVDCYTTWCGPCKQMSKNIFPLKEAGDAINPKYISVGMQLDSTAHDSEIIKARYADAHMIATEFDIMAYPTYLFFSPDGKLVHQAVGSTDVTHFIGFTEDALNPDKQYFTMINKYRQGSQDSVLLESLAEATAYTNKSLSDSVVRAWLSVIKNPYTKERLLLIAQTTSKPEDPGYDIFYEHTAMVDQVMGTSYAEQTITMVIIRNNPDVIRLFRDSTAKPEWDRIEREIKDKYNAEYAHRAISWVKINYYNRRKNWDLFGKYVMAHIKDYGKDMQPEELNSYAWDIFQFCTKPEELATGLALSERSLRGSEKPNPAYVDTYANLLYKTGKTSEAIAKETVALKAAPESDKPIYLATLDKMKAGLKTW